MGKRNRERVARIEAGLEYPMSIRRGTVGTPIERMRHCLKCHLIVPETRARQHIRECWGIPIKDSDPIPERPPEEVISGMLVRTNAKK